MCCRGFVLSSLWFAVSAAAGLAADGNRLTYLDEYCDPYYVGLHTPKLVAPQWVGEKGVRAVVALTIDDLRDVRAYEDFLRPILSRLKRIDGRAPVSIFSNNIDPNDGHLQKWLAEGLSLEAHTIDHPCPCLRAGKTLAWSKETYDRCVDMMAQIPNHRTVAFRMPCCDSMPSVSPRFFTEIFNKTTPEGNYLTLDSSVFNVFTEDDMSLPSALFRDEEGRLRFDKYLPRERGLLNWVENYPYPYIIARRCWQVPAATPDDWQGFNVAGRCNAATLRDMKASLDATVTKEGVYTFLFHPHKWINGDQVVELIDHLVDRHGGRVKVLSLRDIDERLTKHMLGGQPLRADDGGDNGVRVLDVDGDGYMDAVIGNDRVRQTRIWSSRDGQWMTTGFPVEIVHPDRDDSCRDAGVRFGVLQKNGYASLVVRNESVSGLWHFDGKKWVRENDALADLEADGTVLSVRDGRDRGVRLRDLDGDGICELIVGNPRQRAVFAWSIDEHRFHRLPLSLPKGTMIVDADGRDAGLRFVDLDVDRHADVVFSDAQRWSVHRFTSMTEGWSETMISGARGDDGEIPAIVRADGTNNGAWFKFNHMWVQNEETGAKLPQHCDKRHFTDLRLVPAAQGQ